MEEAILSILMAVYAGVIIMFIFGLYIGRYLNSPSIFHWISIASSVSIVVIFGYMKLHSTWFVCHTLWAFALSGYSILLALKFLELPFAYKWTYTRQMPLKLVILYLIAFPRMPKSEAKLSELSNGNARREGVSLIIHATIECAIFQILIFLIPDEWLTLPSGSLPLHFRYLRYVLLSIVLYLAIACSTNYGLGFYSYVTNIPTKTVFPSFPFAATSLREFWSHRWNNLVKTSLHLISFVVIPKLVDPIIPMSNTVKSLIAFALSGLIHEYALRFISNHWSGRNMLFFLLHGIFMSLEFAMKFPVRPRTLHGKLLGWTWTIGIFLLTVPLFFDPMIDAGLFDNMKHHFDWAYAFWGPIVGSIKLG